uniref:Wound-induced protein 1 n=1 Tax=Kalanchoe fedtschenkoi TaxID=63787 RepID=A0A7N0VKT7_KALFE
MKSPTSSSEYGIGRPGLLKALANSAASDEHSSSDSKRVILALYEALRARHVSAVHSLIAPDLEWWFHGPPAHQYLVRLLTGQDESVDFDFAPQSAAAFGPTVLVEGCDPARRISWVHAWTVASGIVVQVREYFNTSLTVTRFASRPGITGSGPGGSSTRSGSIWESRCSERVGKSVPGLVLAL